MPAPRSLPTVDVVVAGYRDLFGTPRALDHVGLLRYLVTDFYVGRGSPLHMVQPLLKYGPKLLRKLQSRDSGLPATKIVANNVAGLQAWLDLRRARNSGAAAVIHHQLAVRLADSLLRRCRPPADVVVGYRMSEVLFRRLPAHTVKVLCQNDGGVHEVEVVREAHRRAPEWQPEGEPHDATARASDWLDGERRRLQEEWALATKIVCWSDWCVRCVVQDDVPEEKCVVLPPMFSPSADYATASPDFEAEPFTVIFLGTLCIRKGTHDLIHAIDEASRERPVRLLLAGANHLDPEILARYRHCIDYRGFVPHRELRDFLAAGHVLALPSYSEGFGMVQLEAMAAGLPVIRSTNTGDAARDGVDGVVVRPGDRAALRDAILTLATDRHLLRHLSENARRRVADFSLETCAARWRAVIEDVTGTAPDRPHSLTPA